MGKRLLIPFLMLILAAGSSYAQLCQGSLGDPIVNITFGAGANPGPPITAAATSYQYRSGDCPDDGYYSVRNRTDQCFGQSWFNVPSDHTGDPNGYFMLVNASFQPGAFYLDTVRGLCASTTYEFAAWIMNVIMPSSCGGNSIRPDLTFSIEQTDGTILKTYNTGSISTSQSPTWNQYGSFFTTPAGVTDVVLRITNNAQGGCGNDLALDDITFRPCGPQLTPSIAGNSSNTSTICVGAGGNFVLNCAVSAGFNNPVFRWQNRLNNGPWFDVPITNLNTLNVTILPTSMPASYQFRMLVAEAGNMNSVQCRIASSVLTIDVVALPVTTAGNDGPVCENTVATLTATGGTQYTWTGPNGFSSSANPVQLSNVQLNQSGKYYVQVKNAAGCSKLDSTLLAVNISPVAVTSFSNANLCKGDSIQLSASGGLTYTWSPVTGLSNAGIANPKASPAASTTYRVVVENQLTCTDTADVNITVIPTPLINAGPDRVMMRSQHIQLMASASGNGYQFIWTPPLYINDVNVIQPVVNPPFDTRYVLMAISSAGCATVMDTVLVKVYTDIYIPNAFTPNGDGLNDTWNIPALAAFPDFELFIYNRYGQPIFRTRTAPVAWDGTYKGAACSTGAYTYLIKTGDGRDVIKGTVMIIR